MDKNASRLSDDDKAKSNGGTAKDDDSTVGGTAKDDDSTVGGQQRPPFIGYDEEYDRRLRESAKQDLVESDALQSVLFKIWRGEFDQLKPKGENSSSESEEPEADDSEADPEGSGAEEADGKGD